MLRSYFIGSCHVGVSKRFSRGIRLAVYFLPLELFFLKLKTVKLIRDQLTLRSYIY